MSAEKYLERFDFYQKDCIVLNILIKTESNVSFHFLHNNGSFFN